MYKHSQTKTASSIPSSYQINEGLCTVLITISNVYQAYLWKTFPIPFVQKKSRQDPTITQSAASLYSVILTCGCTENIFTLDDIFCFHFERKVATFHVKVSAQLFEPCRVAGSPNKRALLMMINFVCLHICCSDTHVYTVHVACAGVCEHVLMVTGLLWRQLLGRYLPQRIEIVWVIIGVLFPDKVEIRSRVRN